MSRIKLMIPYPEYFEEAMEKAFTRHWGQKYRFIGIIGMEVTQGVEIEMLADDSQNLLYQLGIYVALYYKHTLKLSGHE